MEKSLRKRIDFKIEKINFSVKKTRE